MTTDANRRDGTGHYSFIEGSSYFNPEAEYGRSLIDSPHKLSMTPSVQLPFGEGRRFLNESRLANAILGNWTISAVIQLQSGFPIGDPAGRSIVPRS